MKKRYLVLLGFVVFYFLPVSNLYAGKVIDKSEVGYFLFIPKATLPDEKFSILVCFPDWGGFQPNRILMSGHFLHRRIIL